MMRERKRKRQKKRKRRKTYLPTNKQTQFPLTNTPPRTAKPRCNVKKAGKKELTATSNE
jgi:hypothetical protein